MLTKKTMAWTAVILVVVFGVTVMIYPLIFTPISPTTPSAAPVSVPAEPASR